MGFYVYFMDNQKPVQYLLKKDKYVGARGDNSHFLDIYCSRCNQHLLLYQKDGKGRLLRMYLDRIFEPKELSLLETKVHSKKDMPGLKCFRCGSLIGVPMIYELEKRLAYRLIYGMFVKKKSEGIYPPNENGKQRKED